MLQVARLNFHACATVSRSYTSTTIVASLHRPRRTACASVTAISVGIGTNTGEKDGVDRAPVPTRTSKHCSHLVPESPCWSSSNYNDLKPRVIVGCQFTQASGQHLRVAALLPLLHRPQDDCISSAVVARHLWYVRGMTIYCLAHLWGVSCTRED